MQSFDFYRPDKRNDYKENIIKFYI